MCLVALRKESVDRNSGRNNPRLRGRTSLSVRRAWIEILLPLKDVKYKRVALRKESVDRNLFAGGVVGIIGRRSP